MTCIVWGISIIAVCAMGCKHDRAPDLMADAVTVDHPSYPVHARLPRGWVAEPGRMSVIPSDSWTLKPAGGDGWPSITVLLGWLPRGGRQSAFFPGERDDDAHAETVTIAGKPVAATVESQGQSLLCDFEVGDLVVSVRAAAKDGDQRLVRQILAALTIDPAARRPGGPDPRRQALDLARAWADAHGFSGAEIVSTGAGPRPGTERFTVLHAGGLTPLVVDPVSGAVEPQPL